MCCTVNHHSRRVNHRQHVSELRLGHFELGDRLSKGGPLLAVLHSFIEGRLGDTGCQGSDRYSSAPEHSLSIIESLSLCSHKVLLRNLCVFEYHLGGH